MQALWASEAVTKEREEAASNGELDIHLKIKALEHRYQLVSKRDAN